MRNFLFVIVLLCTQQLFSQINYSLQVSSTHAISYNKPTSIRKSGIDIGYRFDVPINTKWNFESGINIGLWGRSNYYIFNMPRWYFDGFYDSVSNQTVYGNVKDYYDRADFKAVDIELPLLVKYKTDKFEYKIGALINGRSTIYINYVWWNPNYSSTEYNYINDIYKVVTPNSGLAFNAAISYKIMQNFKLFAEYKKIVYTFSQQNNLAEYYSLLGFGCSYTFTNK